MVTVYGDGQMRCMGTLVAKDRIITAARCVDPEEFPTKDWKVGLADGTKAVIDKVFMHEEFVKKTDLSSDIAILNLKEAVKVTDELMPVCAQDKGKEEGMTNCQTVHIAPNIDDPTGGKHENVAAKNIDQTSCKANTYNGDYVTKKNMKDLLCIKMNRGPNEGMKGCSRLDVSPLYCNEAKKWYLSGIALSCGNQEMPVAKSKYAWYVDVCNCMDDMIPTSEQKDEGKDEESSGEEEEADDGKASVEKETQKKKETKKETKEETKKEAKKENKKEKKKDNKKNTELKKKSEKRKKEMTTMGWAKKKGNGKGKAKKDAKV